jgi:hypothetical protein
MTRLASTLLAHQPRSASQYAAARKPHQPSVWPTWRPWLHARTVKEGGRGSDGPPRATVDRLSAVFATRAGLVFGEMARNGGKRTPSEAPSSPSAG